MPKHTLLVWREKMCPRAGLHLREREQLSPWFLNKNSLRTLDLPRFFLRIYLPFMFFYAFPLLRGTSALFFYLAIIVYKIIMYFVPFYF